MHISTARALPALKIAPVKRVNIYAGWYNCFTVPWEKDTEAKPNDFFTDDRLSGRHGHVAAIIVKPALGLAPEPARLDVFH